jgi:hypothetical protein
MGGVFLRQDDELVAMTEAPYDAESVLQELLARYPALLAEDGRALLLIRREASVVLGQTGGPRGSLDHLFVDAAGIPTLVEVKRSSDSRVRREVVGQMLDYAANAARYWEGESIRQLFSERCDGNGEDPDRMVLDAFPDLEEVEQFWASVRTNLTAGRMRLVFVADAIPPELRRIVEFLNEQMTQTEVLAIEVKQYRDVSGAHQTLVPRVLGQTEVAREVKGQGRRWDRSSILAKLEEQRSAAIADVARRLFAWVDRRGDLSEGFGSGTKDGSFQAGYWDKPRYLWPFVLYTYGRVEIQFVYMARRPPFDDERLREELRAKLRVIPGVDLPPVTEAKRPSIDMDALAGDGLTLFTDAMDWAYEQADGVAQAPSSPA